MRAIALGLGLGRVTVHRWFGSRERLLGEVLAAELIAVLRSPGTHAGRRGAERIADRLDHVNRALAAHEGLRSFLEHEPSFALRLVTASDGPVQPLVVGLLRDLIEREMRECGWVPPVAPATLAYALVRLSEAFLYNDATIGMRGDVDQLREVEAALLGLRETTSGES